jgi:hypothetical protein
MNVKIGDKLVASDGFGGIEFARLEAIGKNSIALISKYSIKSPRQHPDHWHTLTPSAEKQLVGLSKLAQKTRLEMIKLLQGLPKVDLKDGTKC